MTFNIIKDNEWKTRPKITGSILLHVFFCSMTGAFGNQVFYFVGLSNSPPMVAAAMSNLLPALTFVFAIIFRQETARIRIRSGQAKVLGTMACVGGAMMLSFYHGKAINLGNSLIHWRFVETTKAQGSAKKTSFILGPSMLFASTSSWALWFIIQVKLSIKFPAPYTTTMLMSLMASVECATLGAILEHRPSVWSFSSPIRLMAALYSGIVGSAVAFCVMSWCVERKGPLYTSIFSPLLLILTTVMSWAILHEKIYIGTVVGSVFIIGGLYSVLWGKDKETKDLMSSSEDAIGYHTKVKGDLEVQLHEAQPAGSRSP
ncbi:hypothetical protein MLD38_039786 [Melastoma candidum]|uniref:Uncharacterized protein n=1 Tax=Melastoma candidum TaxID=119954 RepID=A0ACB9L3X8_9MYRT|nr:hypothetical protein MLD38_039786 [Melastoma candidum]